MDKLRKCKIKFKCENGEYSAWFHKWTEIDIVKVSYNGEPTNVRDVKAIVEYEDGTVGLANLNTIIFLGEPNEN